MRCNRRALLDLLSVLRGTVSTRDLNPLYRNCVFSDGYAVSFNGESGVMVRDPFSLRCMVELDKLLTGVSKFSGEELEIVVTDARVQLVSGGAKLLLLAQDPAMFPNVFPSRYEKFCSAANITAAVKTCLSLQNPESQLSQVGILGQYVYSTDGLRCTRVRLDAPTNGSCVVLSTGSAKALSQLGNPINTMVSDSQFIAHFQDCLFVSSMTVKRLPFSHIDSMCAKSPDVDFVKMLPTDFAGALERTLLLCESHSGVSIESTGTDLIVSAERSEVGRSEESFDWPFRKFRVMVNPHHFIQALRHTQTIAWESLLVPEPRFLRFVLPGFDHYVSLMGS